MAAKNEKTFRTFVKGLITEASPLTFPENASIDEQNFVLNRDGSRSRRLGLDYEELYNLVSTGFTTIQLQNGKQSFHRWDSPGGDTTVSIGIIRIINKLWFIDLLTTNPSANLLNSGNPITLANLASSDIEVSIINNKCIIVSADLPDPVLLTYNASTTAVTQSTIDIKIRDLYGVDDGLAINTRPSTLSATHKYNLRNQGWSTQIEAKSTQWDHDFDSSTPTIATTDALDATRGALGGYPSNADSWTLGKNSNPSSGDYEKYDPAILGKNSTSNYQIAKGSFIIDAFSRGASRQSVSDVTTGLPTDLETGTITTVASYAQRIFYSGISSSVSGGDSKSPNYSGYIFFTRVITNDDELGTCYQENDPTDPGLNDLLPADGGTIQIPEASKIIKIVSSQSSLLVFAENGVWEIYGDTGGFIATSFQASKISTNGVLNPKSIVDVNGSFLYWSKAGIYLLTPEQVSGRFKAESVSLTTIQRLFLDIPEVGKNHCKGFYDEKENRVRWLYNDTDDYNTSNYINKYNKEIVLDLTLQAWYQNTLSELDSNSPYIADYIDIPGYAVTSIEGLVLAGADTVQVGLDDVVVDQELEFNRTTVFSFLTIVGTSFTISKYKNSTFKDWVLADNNNGKNYESYLVTGYESFGDILREKQVPYIFFYFSRTENGFDDSTGELELVNKSSCMVQPQWGWADSVNSGKWGRPFQAYRLLRYYTPTGVNDPFDYGQGVITTKNKLRGSGKVLSLKISSEEGKDMKILGWGLPVTATSSV